jgi:hypothetical protein
LIASANRRFNDTLELLEHYREGLGQQLRQAAEEVLKAEAPVSGQIEKTSIVSSEEGGEVTEEINELPRSVN